MPNYPCPNCERVFSRRASLRNHVKTHDNEIDRVLREISEEIVDEMNIRKQMETSDDELIDDANDDERDDTSDNEEVHTSDNEEVHMSDNEEVHTSDNEEVHTSDNEEEYEEEVKYQHIKIVYSYIVYTVY
jgi:hypothetical protein